MDVHAIYEHFLETLRGELERIEQETGEGKTATANNGSNGNGSGLTPTSTPFDGINTGLGGGVNSASSSFNTQTTKPSTSAQSELAERRAEYGLAYIVYMRFGRRAEGIKASRAIFGKARRDRWSPWQVYEAAGTCLSLTYHQNIESFLPIALMEYHCSDDKTVASRIFEKGLDLFGDEIDFVLRYLGFLISINDANSELNVCHEKISMLITLPQMHGRYLSASSGHSPLTLLDLYGSDGLDMSTNMATLRQRRNLRNGWRKCILKVSLSLCSALLNETMHRWWLVFRSCNEEVRTAAYVPRG